MKEPSFVTTWIEFESSTLPKAFDGFRVVHLSDLHNQRFGAKQSELIHATKSVRPDIIVITGDLIERHRKEMDAALEYVSEATSIAPVYFVTGNHEEFSGIYPQLAQQLKQRGVILLENERQAIEREGQSISVIGIRDFLFEQGDAQRKQQLSDLSKQARGQFKLLLSHRPEYFAQYAASGMDLAFAGHAHGGQIRLPFIGGLFAPGQGFFPKYTSGLYRKANSAMIVSRGLSNHSVPGRLFNPFEFLVTTLRCKP